jgi:hypothetical protein
MRSLAQTAARVWTLAAILSASLSGAAYDASVMAQVQFPEPVTNVLERSDGDWAFIADFFYPTVLSGRAGFSEFAGTGLFQSGTLFTSIDGLSGFANANGVSKAEGSICPRSVFLSNLTSFPLPVTLRLEYFYFLSASAGDNETAAARIALDLWSSASTNECDPAGSVLHPVRAALSNGSDETRNFLDIQVTLAPGSITGFYLSAAVAGEATSVPEPGGIVTAAFALSLLLLSRIRLRPAPESSLKNRCGLGSRKC